MSSGTQIITGAALLALAWSPAGFSAPPRRMAAAQAAPGVAILQVDTDRRLGTIERNIYAAPCGSLTPNAGAIITPATGRERRFKA